MSKLFKWEKGRQNTGYEKFTIAYSKLLKFDCYFIFYDTNTYIPPHKDPAPEGYKMYRLNIEFTKAIEGGEFKCEKVIWSLFNRVFLFRPDLYEHSVNRVTKGTRHILSFGKLMKDRKNAKKK